MKSFLQVYRYFSKMYFILDYVTNYRSAGVIENKIDSVPDIIKNFVSKNDKFFLLFLEPRFLGNLFVFIILSIVLHNTILPNTQQFIYSDIPKSMWYIPAYITRFIGNTTLFIVYSMIILWSGLRRFSNDNVSIPNTLLYMFFILTMFQVLLLSYMFAVSGNVPMIPLLQSMNTVIFYMIPLCIIAFMPNIIQLIPSGSVRKHKDIPILPESAAPKGL